MASNATADSRWMLGAYVADFDWVGFSLALDRVFLDEIIS